MTDDPIDPLDLDNPGLRRIAPDGIIGRILADDLVPLDDPYRLGESPDEVTARREAAAAARGRADYDRIARWEARVPERFKEANPGALPAEANPGGKVSGWLDTDVSTLVLRSDVPGVGKTWAAYAICNLAASRRQWVYGGPMIDLNESFRPGRDDNAYTIAQECDLLLVDDLGRERITEWTIERLTGILDARWSNKRRTIITTNLDGATFLSRYGGPIVDRATDDSWTLLIEGQSRRRPAPW